MDFRFTAGQENFRADVRRFLEAEVRTGAFQPRCDAWISGHSPEFSRKLAARGWIGLTWPREYGGQARSHTDRLILTEELLRYGAPAACHWFADRQIGASILAYGTEEQKREWLPKIVRAEAFFALGMSEPEAGSDLAAVKTLAAEQDQGFVIHGQKIWTSGAKYKNYMYLVARTDPDAPRHKGISQFLMRLDLPGITLRPIMDMSGQTHFYEVFFDNVIIPKTSLLGQKNQGFQQIMAQLDYERSGMERLMTNYPLLEVLPRYCRETVSDGRRLSEDPLIRQKLGQMVVEFEIGRLLIYRVAAVMDEGKIPNYEAAMAKDYGSALEQKLARLAMELLGPFGQLIPSSRYAPLDGLAAESCLMSPGYTLMGGTSEVLRNVIAQRGLGLPAK